jgi:heterodisulfide reductase subunit C
MTTVVNPDLARRIWPGTEQNAEACMNCGVCTAVCPMGLDMLPRRLFRFVLLGMEDRVRQESETVFSCLLCKLCEVNCPADVRIADNVRAIRHYFNTHVFNGEVKIDAPGAR